MYKRTGSEKPGGRKFSLKNFWRKLRSNGKADGAAKEEIRPEGNLALGRRIVQSTRTDGEIVDIHEVDKDRIRTCCPEALENPPEFPSREEVKERIENAHKYYGIKCVYNHYGGSEDPDGKNIELQPSWYYILERPLVEQYVLMNNYIRKLSVMAALKHEQSGTEEEPAIEEEVSSISSSSDYADFAPDSGIVAKLKEMKKLGMSSPSQVGASKLERELLELKSSAKSEERTIKTNEYTIIIRETVKADDDDYGNVRPSGSHAIEFGGSPGQLEGRAVEPSDLRSSGDHLPDMNDFDLSRNLVDGPVEIKTGFGRPSYYHWQGNSTPTKTPLLNMDCQPPVRPRAPGTARDFLSFRGLSLSSEFVDSCRDYSVSYAEECKSACLKELAGPEDSEDGFGGFASLGTQTERTNGKPALPLNPEDQMTSSSGLNAEAYSVVERAALACEYSRDCGDHDSLEDLNVGKTVSAASSPAPASSEVALGLFDDDCLLRSISQMNTEPVEAPHFSELEPSSSEETQILAMPTNLD